MGLGVDADVDVEDGVGGYPGAEGKSDDCPWRNQVGKPLHLNGLTVWKTVWEGIRVYRVRLQVGSPRLEG